MSAGTHFFIGAGAEASELVNRGLALLSAHMAKIDAFQRKHGADGVIKFGDGHIHALAFECSPRAPIERRPGLRYVESYEVTGGEFHCFVPDLRNELGKEIAAQAAAIGGFNFSDWVVARLGARRTRQIPDRASATGRGVMVSCAGTVGGKLLLQVPVDATAPYTAPAWLRQVKQSEYLAAQGL